MIESIRTTDGIQSKYFPMMLRHFDVLDPRFIKEMWEYIGDDALTSYYKEFIGESLSKTGLGDGDHKQVCGLTEMEFTLLNNELHHIQITHDGETIFLLKLHQS